MMHCAFGERKIAEVVSGQRSDIMDLTRKSVEKMLDISGFVWLTCAAAHRSTKRSTTLFARMRADREKLLRSIGLMKRSRESSCSGRRKRDCFACHARAESENRAAGQSKRLEFITLLTHETRGSMNLRSMQAYQQAFNDHNDIIVLQPDSEFFKYFKSTT